MPSDETHEETYQQGLKVRREVLGADHVDRSLAQASDFARPIQELVTEYCWGIVWSRDGLERKTRSLLDSGDVDGTQPASGIRHPRARRTCQRRHRGRDTRDASSDRYIRRGARGA